MFTLLGDRIDALRSKIDAGKKYIVVKKRIKEEDDTLDLANTVNDEFNIYG